MSFFSIFIYIRATVHLISFIDVLSSSYSRYMKEKKIIMNNSNRKYIVRSKSMGELKVRVRKRIYLFSTSAMK